MAVSELPPTAADARPRLLDEGGLVVVSYCFPPMSVGPAFIMDRLLSRFDLGPTVVFAGDPDRWSSHADRFGDVDATVFHRDVPHWWPADDVTLPIGPARFRLRLRTAGNMLVGLRVAFEAARALRRPDVRALLAVYPKQHFLLAACLASMATKKPLFVYFTDVYVEGLPSGRRVARLIERYVARRADVQFGMSDAHREHIAERVSRYGGRSDVVEIPHPYVGEEPGDARTLPLEGRPSIVFTGAIYDAQADAIARLIESLESASLEGLDPHLHLFSQTDPDFVARFGITAGPRVSLRAVTSEEALAAQRSADILFLPMAFAAKEHVRRTASPTKMPEYFAAGRPILVHAPPDSYVARYAEEHGFAEVVKEPDAEALARALRRLTTDEARREELIQNARATLRRHEASAGARTLRNSIRRFVA